MENVITIILTRVCAANVDFYCIKFWKYSRWWGWGSFISLC